MNVQVLQVLRVIELTSKREYSATVTSRIVAGITITVYTLNDGRSYTAGEFWRLFRELGQN
jgi:hypothetical protein